MGRLHLLVVSSERALRVYRVTALALLLMFAGHIVHVCQLHQRSVRANDGLLKMSDCYDHHESSLRMEDYDPLSRVDAKMDTSAASRLQRERVKWTDERLARLEASGSDLRQRRPGNSARVVVILLLSCGATFGSCVQLLGALSLDETTNLQSLLQLGYISFPITTRAAGVIAVQLHSARRTSSFEFDSTLCGAIMSTFHLLSFVLPLFVLTRWATDVTQIVEVLSGYQVGMLGLAVLLPMHAMQTRRDDWCVTNAIRSSG
jgi:hypothetical protein